MGIIDCLSKNGQEVFNQPKGCINTYKSKNFQFAQSGNVLAPWVAIDFVDSRFQGSSGAAITVGNNSSDLTNPKNCAVIKSFSLGHKDGTDVRVVIHDTQGGNFEEFVRHILGDWYCLKSPNQSSILMKVQFGWVKSGCKEPIPSSRSPCYFVTCTSIETNFQEGKFIFEIVGNDTCTRMPEGSAEFQVGGDGDKDGEYFIPALIKFLTDPNSPPPNIASVEFILNNPDRTRTKHGSNGQSDFNGKEGQILFNMIDEKQKRLGRKGKYNSNGLNKLETIKKWAHENPSFRRNNWIIRMDTTSEASKLVFEENTAIPCDLQDDSYYDNFSLGTFIVNGGPMSPVIEFNPKMKWDFAMVVGAGGAMGPQKMNSMESQGGKNQGATCMPKETVEGAGQSQGTEPSDNIANEGQDATKQDAENEALIKKNNGITPHAISADLVIVGDPTFCPPNDAIGIKFVSIVLINPFHISPQGNDKCGDWLATPACNEVLSNKGWIIKSVNHQIDAGNYKTTIEVQLSSPGMDLPAGKNFGGWTKGWKPSSCLGK